MSTEPQLKVDLRDLTPKQSELIAAMAVKALISIASYCDSDEFDDEDGLARDEAIEMAYDNVLTEAHTTLHSIVNLLSKQG